MMLLLLWLAREKKKRFAQVTVNDAFVVEVFEGVDELSGVEARNFLGEGPVGFDALEQLAARAQLDHVVQARLAAEGVEEPHNVGVAAHAQNVPLGHDVLLLVQAHHKRFLNNFERERTTCG